jgi:hypothetical protein
MNIHMQMFACIHIYEYTYSYIYISFPGYENNNLIKLNETEHLVVELQKKIAKFEKDKLIQQGKGGRGGGGYDANADRISDLEDELEVISLCQFVMCLYEAYIYIYY